MRDVPVRAYIGLGANLGHPRAAIERALAALATLPATVLATQSSLYRSEPIDAIGPDFVNAVAAIDTRLDARNLLDALHAIERAQGRTRGAINAPRTLDLDLLLYGDECRDDPMLTLPHPRLHLRSFVLEPLAELAPDLQIPGRGVLGAWRLRARGQRVERIGLLQSAGAPMPAQRDERR